MDLIQFDKSPRTRQIEFVVADVNVNLNSWSIFNGSWKNVPLSRQWDLSKMGGKFFKALGSGF